MKKRIILLSLTIMLLITLAVSCAPAEAPNAQYVSGLGSTINAYQEYKGWVYYIDYNTFNLYKAKLDGEKRTLIINDPVYSFIIYEDRIFYTNYQYYLYSANIDGSDDRKLYSLNEELLADGTIRAEKMQIVNGWIYTLLYGEMYKFKTDGSEKTVIKYAIFEDFCIEGDKIYHYSRPLNDKGARPQLWQMITDGTQDQQLTQESVSAIDYDENWIYYIDAGNDDIYKVSYDGNEKYKIIECNGRYIKVLGDWIFYEQYGEKNGIYKGLNRGLYKIKKDGSENTYITDDLISFYGIFDQWFLCYGNEICAIKFGESSETAQFTYDIISEWPYTTIYD